MLPIDATSVALISGLIHLHEHEDGNAGAMARELKERIGRHYLPPAPIQEPEKRKRKDVDV